MGGASYSEEGVVLGSVMGVLVTGEGVLLASMMGGGYCWRGALLATVTGGCAGYWAGGVARYYDLERRRDVAGYYNWPVGVARFGPLRDRSFTDHLGVGGAAWQVAVEREDDITHV